MDIKEVKKDVIYTVIGDRLAIPKGNFEWLIEQAEKLEKIHKVSNAEDVTLADFAKETLRIIEGREETRNARS